MGAPSRKFGAGKQALTIEMSGDPLDDNLCGHDLFP